MKTTVLLVLLVAVALVAAALIFTKPSYPLTQEDAKKFFLEDLQGKYPDAEIREVSEITQLAAADGTPYYQLRARVTKGFSTPCPERLEVYYDYPPKNFVAQPPEYITRGCKVCLNVEKCVLAYPEEAIIASHTYSGAEAVADFVKRNADAKPSVSFEETYNGHFGVWLVKWSSAASGAAYTVVLSKNANVVLEVSAG